MDGHPVVFQDVFVRWSAGVRYRNLAHDHSRTRICELVMSVFCYLRWSYHSYKGIVNIVCIINRHLITDNRMTLPSEKEELSHVQTSRVYWGRGQSQIVSLPLLCGAIFLRKLPQCRRRRRRVPFGMVRWSMDVSKVERFEDTYDSELAWSIVGLAMSNHVQVRLLRELIGQMMLSETEASGIVLKQQLCNLIPRAAVS